MREVVFDKCRGVTHRTRLKSGDSITYDILTTKNDVTNLWRLTIDSTSHGSEFRLVVLDCADRQRIEWLHKQAVEYALTRDDTWASEFEEDALESLATKEVGR